MTSNFHGSPDFWLDMPLEEMNLWAKVASRMFEKEKQKHNTQRIGPGL